MLKSMTGYGLSEHVRDGVQFRVEIRSVNHRFREVMVRLPRELFPLEERIKKEVQQTFTRGRLDVFVTLQARDSLYSQVEVDWKFAERIVDSVRKLKERFALTGDLSVADLLHIPEVLSVHETPAYAEDWETPLFEAVQKACASLLEMRRTEGMELAHDLRVRMEHVAAYIESLRGQAPQVVALYRTKMEERIAEFLQGPTIDEARLLSEVALFAEKCNIDEELTRLSSHAKQFGQMLSAEDAVGRKLDFLVQEMNREINTVGAKANDLTISRLVVEIKSELEKIREQVQNIE